MLGTIFCTTLIELASEPRAIYWSRRVWEYMVCSIASVSIPSCISLKLQSYHLNIVNNVSHIVLFVLALVVCSCGKKTN